VSKRPGDSPAVTLRDCPTQHAIPSLSQPQLESDSESSSSDDSTTDEIPRGRQPKNVTPTRKTPRQSSPSPSPPSVALPSFLPVPSENHAEEDDAGSKEKELQKRFRQFWMTSVADGFKEDLEEIRKVSRLDKKLRYYVY
jgi:ribosome assembly protein 3